MPLAQLAQTFDALAAESNTPYRIPHMLELERTLAERGAGPLMEEIRSLRRAPNLWPSMFDYAWLSSCIDRARTDEPALAGFNRETHQQFIDEFRQLDLNRLSLAAARVRRVHAEHVIQTMNEFTEETALVRREAEKKARHIPLRKLLAQAPHVLTSLCPCWMASPLSVSQLLDSTQRYFDVVIFDEASQVLPEDAVASLLRGSHAIVAGDKYQLPPTTFFAASDDQEAEADSESPTEGFESILDLMSAFVEPWSLDWHYRSRDESLIAFSNRHIYSNRLITFPGTGGPPVIQHVLVQQTPQGDGESESSAPEVQRVVELVLQHAAARPDETLGVIAMGITHAQRIQAALDRALESHAGLDTFFDLNTPERFFVKNLERVQGDERDAIILSIGYSKDRTGRLLYHFGPLLSDGGERRLNVAITRARNRLTLVSSFDHTDMDPGRSNARGVELLRLYLQYAASRGENLGDTGRSNVPINAFEADVLDALTSRGIHLIPQWGASKYRIDFVAQHPERPGRFVLAIECDGASYHSAPTARDRDRLRQQHLEALGWKFHRIW
jgi:REase_MTES_1575/AAA domain